MKTNHAAGVDAEDLASAHLKANGYKILEKRFKTKHGEVDIIARKPKELAFIEVKKRKNFGFDDPISPTQKKRIANAALQYLAENEELNELEMRFDSIFIDAHNNIEHITDAWRTS